ncbi:MAG: DUF1080 domain-containing protein [Pirellulaceae bacterium]|nr:DUF1080 domain-containing protein [Pirellulaceae bacterium]
MFRRLVCVALCLGSVSVALSEQPQKAPAKSPNLKSIFNGKDLSGWDGDKRLWSVQDGVLHGETTEAVPATGNTFIIWKDGVVKDFELRLSFRCKASNNSGIQYRSKHIVDDKVKNKWVVRGYQHELRNEADFPNISGFIYDEGGTRKRMCMVGEKATWGADGKQVIGELITPEEFKKLYRLDEWNDVVIIANGPHIQHYLNDRLILDFVDKEPKLALSEGILALQLHAGKPMWVDFKNIELASTK